MNAGTLAILYPVTTIDDQPLQENINKRPACIWGYVFGKNTAIIACR